LAPADAPIAKTTFGLSLEKSLSGRRNSIKKEPSPFMSEKYLESSPDPAVKPPNRGGRELVGLLPDLQLQAPQPKMPLRLP
jgi:hypothetical protein